MDDFAMAEPVAPDAVISGLGAMTLPEMPPAEAVTMIEVPAPEARLMVDSRTCVVCGREFEAMQRYAKCESRPTTCASCCPHPFCNEHSPFAD